MSFIGPVLPPYQTAWFKYPESWLRDYKYVGTMKEAIDELVRESHRADMFIVFKDGVVAAVSDMTNLDLFLMRKDHESIKRHMPGIEARLRARKSCALFLRTVIRR